LLESNDRLRDEVLGYLAERFGITPARLGPALFAETPDGEIWISTSPTLPVQTRRPAGLRALRRTPSGLKPTSAFLVSLASAVTAGHFPCSDEALRALLLGRRLACSCPDGYVALTYGLDIIGCGLVADGTVHSLLPTGRRRELLDVLDAHP